MHAPNDSDSSRRPAGVDEYDATYWGPLRQEVDAIHDDLIDGRHHVYEAEMKERRRTATRPTHTSRP